MNDKKVIQDEITDIVQDFLYRVGSVGSHNHFKPKSERRYLASAEKVGFNSLYEEIDNRYVVEEELFLEGCIRVFLINPIMKKLLEYHDIQNEWMFGDTISNRECEIGNYIQFIAVLDGEKVGVRYTKPSYTLREYTIMERDKDYQFGKRKIPGFDVLSPVDSIITLDWTGALKPVKYPHEMKGTRIVSVIDFFESYFSIEEYETVMKESKKAVKKAKEIIALRAIPQLLPNNIFNFKQSVMNDFTKEKMSNVRYVFKNDSSRSCLSNSDKYVIDNNFYDLMYCRSIIGNKDFAKSYITSEYLYRSIHDGLSIDYTSVVVGYLKSVEQLLYLLYMSAFEGGSKLLYWDSCKKNKKFFDPEKTNYRFDPYDDIEKGVNRNKQELYCHSKRTGNNALEIGGLIFFLRYYEKMWAVSEEGKEFICMCLNDYRQYCRNSFFHKDNIDNADYETVTRIRNNTQICLYYLLGAFKLLDSSISEKEQLGIHDNRLEMLYYYTQFVKRHIYRAVLPDNTEVLLYYKRNVTDFVFNEAGELISGTFTFIRIDTNEEQLSYGVIDKLLKDDEYVEKNNICFSLTNLPVEITPVVLRK